MVVAVAAGVALSAGASAASAAGTASGTYRLSLRVPVACWVQPENGGMLQAASNQAGRVQEACNNPGGFRIFAHYRQLSANESARLTYAGRTMDLPRLGEQMLRQSSMAQIRTVDYRFDEVSLNQPLVLALTIEPI